ncbi:DUF5062 family protein [Thalassotalea ponticola]|uniref:DUF5062 family protein n=1 Tax=Thalassotalea ponticola TaxID=1523392 RepID=UPI0025B45061|nr:DUF5062 family protein [Thalassotalea ponticola]MDN3651924.1 DUF5062 family protein [Thalassotalea ponticola]
MKKIKNEAQLLKVALRVGENYAVKQGYNAFSTTDSSKQKIEALYRLLVHDKLLTAVPVEQENLLMMKHKLALWVASKLPDEHPLRQ